MNRDGQGQRSHKMALKLESNKEKRLLTYVFDQYRFTFNSERCSDELSIQMRDGN